MRFLVQWCMEFDDGDVETPREAAALALKVHRDPQSIATVFQVTDQQTGETTEVDLDEEDFDASSIEADPMSYQRHEADRRDA